MAASEYFSMIVREIEHPFLYAYIQRTKERGLAKKFICDAAENALKSAGKSEQEEEARRQEAAALAEIQHALEEIKGMLQNGVMIQTENEERIVKESSRVRDALSKLVG